MVEVYKPQEIQENKEILSTPSELQALSEDVNSHLKKTMEAYLETNITINGKKINFSDEKNSIRLIQNTDNPYIFDLAFDNTFLGLGLQDDKNLPIKVQFERITDKDKQNYYVKFNKETSTFPKDVVFDPTSSTLVYQNVVYDFTVPKERQKSSDIRIEANAIKTKERIKNKVAEQQFTSLTKIQYKPEFENTQITGLGNVILGKEVIQEGEYYVRTISMYDTQRKLYRPISKVYFDKTGNIDPTKTDRSPQTKILGQEIGGEMGIKDDILQFRFKQQDITNLEERLTSHRKKLIAYINEAKVAPKGMFPEFIKDILNGELLFDTNTLELDLINDTYYLKSSRKIEKTIRFGFDYAPDPSQDKIYIKDAGGKKIEPTIKTDNNGNIIGIKNGFDVFIDKNNSYTIFDNNGKLAIFKAKEAKNIGDPYPGFTGSGEKYIKNQLFYKNTDKIEYYTASGAKIIELPAQKNQKGERKLEETKNNVNTNHLIDMKNFSISSYQNLNLNETDIKTAFQSLMEKEKIKLQERKTVPILIDANKGTYEYYVAEQKKAGDPIKLEKDKDLHDTADKIMEMLKIRLEMIEKIENMQLWRKNKKQEKRFEGSTGGGRGLEKSALTTQNKIDFINGKTGTFIQDILRGEGEKTTMEYEVKGRSVRLNIKDPKAIKLADARFLSKKTRSTIDVQNYKVYLKTGKLYFDNIE